jgi:hypothetical protein
MERRYSFEQFQQDCESVTPEASAIAAAGVGVLATELTAEPVIGVVAGRAAGDIVQDHWQDSCALPAAIADVVGPQQSPTIDSPAPAADPSISID